LGTDVLRFRRAVIATGARAAIPPIPGLDEVGHYTNETIFSLTDLPERLVVLGAGPIGCELAQAFARLGSRVTIVSRGDRVLSRDDPEAASLVETALRADGVTFEFGVDVQMVERRGGGIRVHCARGGASRPPRATCFSSRPDGLPMSTISASKRPACGSRSGTS
jgi:pyruvate/2-oxoglutarate dehydrogenase complex dihydrolipoamide dehydrogenase (E3) component